MQNVFSRYFCYHLWSIINGFWHEDKIERYRKETKRKWDIRSWLPIVQVRVALKKTMGHSDLCFKIPSVIIQNHLGPSFVILMLSYLKLANSQTKWENNKKRKNDVETLANAYSFQVAWKIISLQMLIHVKLQLSAQLELINLHSTHEQAEVFVFIQSLFHLLIFSFISCYLIEMKWNYDYW